MIQRLSQVRLDKLSSHRLCALATENLDNTLRHRKHTVASIVLKISRSHSVKVLLIWELDPP